MPAARRPHVIAIVGPTAVGKSALAEELAVRLGGEIVSADSMQVYRGMDIGTAKPPPEHRRVPYHLIDVVDPGTPFSAALYQKLAREAIEDIAARGRLPVVCGGTGLYVRAALDDMRFPAGEQVSAEREELEGLGREIGGDALHVRLRAVDPESAALIHPNNVRRTIRALEMVGQGVTYAQQAAGFSSRMPYFEATYIGLAMDRPRLYERIDARVDAMLAAGLLEEVRALLAAGFRDALTANQAIGYKEFVPVIESGASLGDAVFAVKQATRRYAKRQLTWFRADSRVRWEDADLRSPEELAASIGSR
jgi:tRNA dimethylallyltransferase